MRQLRKQNSKTERKYLPGRDADPVMLELIELVSEIDLLRIKRDDAEIACQKRYNLSVGAAEL